MKDRQLHAMPTAHRYCHASITTSVAYDAMNIASGKIAWAKPLCDALQWLPLDRNVKLLLEAENQIEHIDTHATRISETRVSNHSYLRAGTRESLTTNYMQLATGYTR